MQTGPDQTMQPDSTNSKQAETRTGVLIHIRPISIKCVDMNVNMNVFLLEFVFTITVNITSYTYTGVGARSMVMHI